MAQSQFEQVARQIEGLSVVERIRLVERIMKTIEAEVGAASPPKPKRSLYGLWADQGVDVSAEDIDEVRRDMLANFPREDIA